MAGALVSPCRATHFFQTHLPGREKVSKNACPCIRTRRPRFAALDFPPDRAFGVACWSERLETSNAHLFRCSNLQTARTRSPFRRPSAGAAQGDARHGCRARRDGTWMSLRAGPGAAPEGGKFCEAKPGCGGGLLFGYFFLATQEKVTRLAGRNQCLSHPANRGNPRIRILAHRTTRQRQTPRSAGLMESLRSGRSAWMPREN